MASSIYKEREKRESDFQFDKFLFNAANSSLAPL